MSYRDHMRGDNMRGDNMRGDNMRGDNTHTMMTDPSIANARIYVGNIPTNDMSKRDLLERFEKHGAVLGVSLNRGFGFVQYEDEASALEAIKLENGALFRGNQIEVNPARVFGGGRGRGDGPGSRRNDSDNFRDRSPISDRGRDRNRERDRDRDFDRDRDWRDQDRYDKDHGMFFGREAEFSKESVPFSGQDKFRSGPLGSDDRGSGFGKDPFGGQFHPGIGDSRGSIPRDYPAAGAIAPVEKPNDCEIIVFNKNQRDYAEYIERRLKQLGLSVDILFPNEEVPISRVLANISSRGSLFAITVMPQNEEHRSLTLNILHGLPQEHRNMPLEDAVPLIKRNFDAYMRGDKGGNLPGISGPVPTVPVSLPVQERHPDAMQVLLNLLSDNRPLTVLQYDRIIQYLQDRRELQLKIELGDAKDFAPAKEPTSKKQVDLQHRILNILNNQATGISPAPVAPPAGNWQQMHSTPTPLLNDPNVQKALDSLMQGNVLNKLAPSVTSNASLGTPPAQPLFGIWASHSK